ncbi:MAG: sodium:calcium antiporter [Acidiferrobacter sp.]
MEAWLLLAVGLPTILLGAELFTNAVEHVGAVLGVSAGVAGSLLAAVGTAMPETAVPVLAALQPAHGGADLAVGAILGAPLMLSTLTLALVALATIGSRGRAPLTPERSGLRRDLSWFLAAFAVATVGLFVPYGAVRAVLAVGLVGAYGAYAVLTVRASRRLVAAGHMTTAHHGLHLARGRPGHGPGLRWAQLALGLVLIVGGAELFVHGIKEIGTQWGVPVLALALVLVPVATELPEKVNSILWVRRRQDTLALANITGALVFQGSLLPALGMMLTPWRPTPLLVVGASLTLVAAGFVRLLAAGRRPLRPVFLLLNGLLYGAFLGYLVWS